MRTLVLWCPDWPVVAAGLPATVPAAVLADGEVLACSPAARVEGVRRGMRRRDAQARCPELRLVERAPHEEARRFDEVLEAVEHLTPGVAPIRPGLCALHVPPRYYGGERETAAVLAERIVELGVWDVRCGIADGVFAAEHAARRALTQDVWIVPPGGSAAFVAELGVDVIDDTELADLLRRLGLRTLGAFARLGAGDVRTRFGDTGALLHRLARGEDPQPIARRQAPPDLLDGAVFEPALENSEAAVFSLRTTAERWVAQLAHHGLVATAVRIEVDSGQSTVQSRLWRHPVWFDAAALLDRVRWQLAAGVPGPGRPDDPAGVPGPGRPDDPAGVPGPGRPDHTWSEGITAVRFVPEETAGVCDHAETLFGSGPDAQVERGAARVQALAGPDAVQRVRPQGGRGPRDRGHAAPWGERVEVARPAERPWPGQIPAPAPATVFATPPTAAVAGAEGQQVALTSRGAVSAVPARFRASSQEPWQQVAAWAGPWPVDERWWDEAQARRIARFQVVGVDGRAWLLVLDGDAWFTEARYD